MYKKKLYVTIFLWIILLLYLYIMKKQKIKKFFKRHIFSIIVSFFLFWTVFWSYTSLLIVSQQADNVWSNNSQVSFTWTTDKEWYYVNNKENSAIINNYFEWYYFDNLYWFFKLNWSSDKYKNVRIVDSTWKCSTWYWYKLWWKAYSENGGYIDFNYGLNTFVYYCLDTWTLHWSAYSSYIWYQSFEWISISVVNSITDLTNNVNKKTVFENDSSHINEPTSSNPTWFTKLGWDIYQIDVTKESIFYIVK